MSGKLFSTLLTILLPLMAGAIPDPGKLMADISAGLYSPRSVYGVRSMADGEHYTSMGKEFIGIYAYATGELTDTLFSASWAKPSVKLQGYQLSGDERRVVLVTNAQQIYRHSFTADHIVYDRDSRTLQRLTVTGGERDVALSPDGTRAAFVRDNNIFTIGLDGSPEQQLTFDGQRNRIINGATDWVYEEEFGFSRAFCFSPDGKQLAWMRFNESRVKEYTMMRYGGGLYPQPYTFKYPMAGEENSQVELYICDLDLRKPMRIDAGAGEFYIPHMDWTATGKFYFLRTNRLQNRLEVILRDNDGTLRNVYTEVSPRYVDRPNASTVTFLPDGERFVVQSEADGRNHLYLYSARKGLLRQITRGDWEVTSLLDISGDKAYFLSTEGSHLRRGLYSIALDGRHKTLLTRREGYYSIAPSAGFRYFIAYYSNPSTPLVVSLHRADGTLVRTLEDNAALTEKVAKLPQKEFFTFVTPDGATLYGSMLKPHGFDPSKRYPVLMSQYSGPGSQQVSERWSIDWENAVVEAGYVVVMVDPRGTGFRGEEFKKCTYRNLGGPETVDQIAAARYLGALPWVDASRIGIYGWSYGGFMALNCMLKGEGIFKMAIAVAPVTSWRYYDTIYTEIYNGLPQDNPSGYDNNSPINHAGLLKGKLLIVHGTSDDNVHVTNTYAMAAALVRAGKQFDMMIYPDDNHGMLPSGRVNVRQKMVDYTIANL